MTEQEYNEIAAACDRLLRGADTSLARIAIPALHVINEHPSCTSAYEPGANQLSAWEDPPRAVLRAARAWLRASLRGRSAAPSSGAIDVLIVSHLVNATQLEQDDDFYFGPLLRLLADNGATSVVALVNHLRPGPTHNPLAKTILPDHAPPTTEANLWLQAFQARSQLRAAARSAQRRLDRQIALLASRQAWLASTVDNLRTHWSVGELCKAHRPKIVLTTFEGEACERLIWHAARSAGNKPLCVGYQHARVLPRSHAIRRPIGIPAFNCDPDVVLTAGDHSHEILASSPGLAAVKFMLYGSHRRPPTQQRTQHTGADTCLVLSDASPQECTLLFEFACACAAQLPAMSFKLRPHPATNMRALPRMTLPANVSFSSDTTLAADCAGARYCLYRGSSAVVQAVMAGVKPFYVAQPNELPIDPLAGMSVWRETISKPTELATTDRDDSAEWQAAVDFCQRYTSPLRPEAITQLLNNARSACVDSIG